MSRKQIRAQWFSLVIGLGSIAVVLAFYHAGWLDWLEARAYDLRVLHANSIGEHDAPRIVCIDIDNSSLQSIGRWPWHRDEQAPLVSIPAELGAVATLVDITWTEKQTFREEFPDDADVAADPLIVARQAGTRLFPDFELRSAIEAAGNVYLNYDFPPFEMLACDEFDAAVDAVLAGDLAEAQRQLEVVQAHREPQYRFESLRVEDQARESFPINRARMVAYLQQHPLTGETELARRLELSRDFVDGGFRAARRAALRRIVANWRAAGPERAAASPQRAYRQVAESLGSEAIGVDSILGHDLAAALRWELGKEATLARGLVPLERVRSVARRVEDFTPAYFDLARVAKGCGFAVFEPDEDGVVRRMPLFAAHGGKALPQMAFVLGCDLLGVDGEGISARPGEIRLTPRDANVAPRVIQLDGSGAMLIPWVRGDAWIRQYSRVPARSFVEVARNRMAVDRTEFLVRETLRAALTEPGMVDLAPARKALADFESALAALKNARLDQDPTQIEVYESAIGELMPEIRGLEAEVSKRLEQRGGSSSEPAVSTRPAGEMASGEAESLAQTLRTLRHQHSLLQADIAKQLEVLREKVSGNVCLIGYTATSLADMKPTPSEGSVPGVMAHASLLNAMLANRFVWRPPVFVDVLITLGLGIVSTITSTWLRPRLALLLVVFLAIAYIVVGGATAFHRWALWMALTPVLWSLMLPLFLISIYRYVFIDSERRQLSTALSQYTSKEIARQMADNPELCQRAESREVTAMFTDLRGFTTISEKIGAARTQKLLNVCLGRSTEVMLKHEAMVNKFIGDGIFAFWNPVIFPQPDHARRACETAIDLITDLNALKRERRDADPVYDELFLRVGVATGNAIVGPCGSEQKFDYTCIGDTVNLAARLESANKFFGTQILVAGAAQDPVRDAFGFRALGGVQVKGKRDAVPVFELLGRAGQIPDELLTYADAFNQAVRLFSNRDWDAAVKRFEECSRMRPDDLAAQRYADAAEKYRLEPPKPDWNGSIELSEK